jgi:23S rRNA (cytosine1962-C5)-methyltransferase
LKIIELSKEGAQKVTKGANELYPRDLEGSVKSCTPGEWLYLKNSRKNLHYLSFVNPLAINSPIAHLTIQQEPNAMSEEQMLFSLIERSVTKRDYFKEYNKGCRLIYGNADYLPGLVVDAYKNAVIIQINTAGIDKYRVQISKYFTDKFQDKKIYLLDNEIYRQREALPIYEKVEIEQDLEIEENDLKFIVEKEKVQKVGYYYDHRENRARAKTLVKKLSNKYSRGLDLFSYVGSWGLNLLSGGVEHMTFVDQGDMKESTIKNLDLNGFSENGIFIRQNVFDFLKDQKAEKVKYNIICSDPPAFCKSKKDERKAYDGYLKLHKMLIDLLEPDSILIACSCTLYIDWTSFQKNIEEAAFAKHRKIQLLDCGVQGFDHPTTNLNNKNSYLKYFAYRVE